MLARGVWRIDLPTKLSGPSRAVTWPRTHTDTQSSTSVLAGEGHRQGMLAITRSCLSIVSMKMGPPTAPCPDEGELPTLVFLGHESGVRLWQQRRKGSRFCYTASIACRMAAGKWEVGRPVTKKALQEKCQIGLHSSYLRNRSGSSRETNHEESDTAVYKAPSTQVSSQCDSLRQLSTQLQLIDYKSAIEGQTVPNS